MRTCTPTWTRTRQDLAESILRAYEKDGKLYSIPVYYTFRTMAVPASIAGERTKWTLDEMMEIADSYLPDSMFFRHESKEHVLRICLRANIGQVTGAVPGGQGLDRDLLMKMLTFAGRFAAEDSNNEDLVIRAQEAGQLQCVCCESLFEIRLHQTMPHVFGEPVVYLGYPSETGNGNLISSVYEFAISEACADKEAAWQFISSLLSEENQTDPYQRQSFGFPLRTSAREAAFAVLMEKLYGTGANGEQEERPTHQIVFYGKMLDLYAVREEDAAMIRELTENADTLSRRDEQVMGIITEEAGHYFSGAKSIGETVDVIEDRLRIYLMEREN